ncbi:MAG: hypothetical protein UDG94_10370 [Peptococcaceae bacterium]|nr:hypothetical protein [Peptococcaceae bacterium]
MASDVQVTLGEPYYVLFAGAVNQWLTAPAFFRILKTQNEREIKMFILSGPVCRTAEGVQRSALLHGAQQAQGA